VIGDLQLSAKYDTNIETHKNSQLISPWLIADEIRRKINEAVQKPALVTN